MSVVLTPLVKWAQDRNLVYLTVQVSDAVVNSLEIEEKSVRFKGTKTRVCSQACICNSCA